MVSTVHVHVVFVTKYRRGVLRPEHHDLLEDVFASLRQRFEMRTHQDHLWSPTYLAASAGGAPLSIIRQYIEAQRQPA